MEHALPDYWFVALDSLDHAFQPIVLPGDGSAYGFEALLRGWDVAGFGSIEALFDQAYAEGILYALDLELRRRAFAKFAGAGLGGAKIFYNIDNRLFQMPDYETGNTLRLAEEAGIPPSRIVFELSELHEPGSAPGFDHVVSTYRDQGFRIALDDFGSGYAGLKFLHRADPDIVKIDRYFVAGAPEDPRKAAFVEKIAGMAHLMGIRVVAEGVETERELRICIDAGCDMIQGYHIARPRREIGALSSVYPSAVAPDGRERRTSAGGGRVDDARIARPHPLSLGSSLPEVLERFRKDPEAVLIPVVDGNSEPAGAYRERDFRQYVYSPFGISLLSHLAADWGASALLVRPPVAPLGTELARIVELYGASPHCGGVIMTEGGRYTGILPAEDLLALVGERELAEARDQNPLTRLPGNTRIAEICARRLADPGPGTAYAYFDFDNFKPFNDYYGFRSGDRVIMLFADILRSIFTGSDSFIGHLGGDDFFASVREGDIDAALSPIVEAAARFVREASSFYAPEDRERGWIRGKDRSGRLRRLPLMTVSVAVAYMEGGTSLDAEGLSESLAALKKEAKASPRRIALKVVGRSLPRRGESEALGAAVEEAAMSATRTGGDAPRSFDSAAENGAVLPVFTPSLISA